MKVSQIFSSGNHCASASRWEHRVRDVVRIAQPGPGNIVKQNKAT